MLCGVRYVETGDWKLYSVHATTLQVRAATTCGGPLFSRITVRAIISGFTPLSGLMMARLVEGIVRSSSGAQTHKVFGSGTQSIGATLFEQVFLIFLCPLPSGDRQNVVQPRHEASRGGTPCALRLEFYDDSFC